VTAPATNVPLRAALYLRVSTARQAEHDVSIPDQKPQGEAYCESRGLQLVETKLARNGVKLVFDHTGNGDDAMHVMMQLAYLSPEVLEHLVIRRVPPALSLHDLVTVADRPWAEQMDMVFEAA